MKRIITILLLFCLSVASYSKGASPPAQTDHKINCQTECYVPLAAPADINVFMIDLDLSAYSFIAFDNALYIQKVKETEQGCSSLQSRIDIYLKTHRMMSGLSTLHKSKLIKGFSKYPDKPRIRML